MFILLPFFFELTIYCDSNGEPFSVLLLEYANKQGHRIRVVRDDAHQKMKVFINDFLFRKEKCVGSIIYWRCNHQSKSQYVIFF